MKEIFITKIYYMKVSLHENFQIYGKLDRIVHNGHECVHPRKLSPQNGKD